MFAGLLVGVWVARYLGPAQFGLLSYAINFVALFATIASFGVGSIVKRELVKDHTKKDVLIGTAFGLKFLGAFVMLLILAFAINFTSNDGYTNTLIFIIASAAVFQSFNVFDIYFQSRVMSKFVVYTSIIGLFISSIIKIIFILNAVPLVAFAWLVLFDAFVMAIGLVYFYINTHSISGIKNLRFKKAIAIGLLKDGWPHILSGIVLTVYAKIDQLMIKEMLDVGAVGQYAAALRLSVGLYFISGIVTSSIFPAIVNAKKHSEAFYYARLQKLYGFVVWISIGLASVTTLLASDIINLLYGIAYNQASSVLIVHVWSGIFSGLMITSGAWFVTENLIIEIFYRHLAAALINIILNYFLIKSYGIVGAAYASLIAVIISGFLYDFFNAKTRVNFYLKCKAFIFIFRLNQYK